MPQFSRSPTSANGLAVSRTCSDSSARIPRLYIAEQRDRRLLNTVLFEAFKGSLSRPAVLTRRGILRTHSRRQSFSARSRIDRSESRRRNRASAGDRLARFHRRAVGASSRDCRFRRESICLQPRSRDRPAGRTRHGGRRKSGVVRGVRRRAETSISPIAGVTPIRITTPHFSLRLGHPVAVNPDRRLRAAALNRQWPVIHFDKAADLERPDNFDSNLELNHDSERSTRGSDGAA